MLLLIWTNVKFILSAQENEVDPEMQFTHPGDGEQDSSASTAWHGAHLHLQVVINTANLHQKDSVLINVIAPA